MRSSGETPLIRANRWLGVACYAVFGALWAALLLHASRLAAAGDAIQVAPVFGVSLLLLGVAQRCLPDKPGSVWFARDLFSAAVSFVAAGLLLF